MVVPTIATRNFASPTMPQVRLGRVYHRLTFVAARKLAARGARSVFREWEEHAARLGGAAPGASVVGALVAVSPVLLPRPTDWPDVVHLTGFWFPPATPHAVSAPLRAFVDGGPPPLVFGFGSMRDDDPRGLQAVVREAVCRLGMRAVFVGGSGDALSAPADDDAVFSVPFADYSWLFPRAAAIVHQGGVGTASYALAAGVPQVTVPYCLDHTFWAARLREAGVAPNGILRSRISAPGLVRAITTVLDQPRFRDAASRCAARVRQENGLDAAEQLVYRQFGFTRPSLSPA
jgi:UDP:flavonoid glycosyltransferase YjiC (YdhE family)